LVNLGSCRVWPSANGITTPSGAKLVSPARGYVAKLGLRCSPSVTTGDPSATSRATVSRTASSYRASSSSAPVGPAAWSATAASSSAGRGMLPIGSVGIIMRAR
jgi:hypothetical protein